MKILFYGEYSNYLNACKGFDPMNTFYCIDKKEAINIKEINSKKGIECKIFKI